MDGDGPAPDRPDLVAALAGPGFGVDAGFLDSRLVAALREDVARRDAGGEFRAAAVGAGAGRAVRPRIRGDRICWIDAPSSEAEREVMARISRLREDCNRELMAGLVDFEGHYAIYDRGAHYVRHLDRSPLGAERVVTLVLYLNAQWTAGDGGELVIATDAGEVEIAPCGGTLVAFLSQRFEHEVRAANRERVSLTGWFRRRPSLGPAL